ncbi:nitrite reductase small subunit NirD [Paenibacillus sp. FSL H8-0537]|uniref:nitrite reductase small subunit NirD n=1 Tax=Paenibacillus sp. FSL H8-0537 TaxID=2921399 RepID=UPI003100E1A7
MSKLLIGKLSDIDIRGSRTVRVKETEIALFRLEDGSVLAIENRCPHKGGLLSEGMVCGTVVHCPLHDWKVDLQSGLVKDPDDGCVMTFDTEIDPEDGAIYVTI